MNARRAPLVASLLSVALLSFKCATAPPPRNVTPDFRPYIHAAALLWTGEPFKNGSGYCSSVLVEGSAPGIYEGVSAAHCLLASMGGAKAVSEKETWITIPGHEFTFKATVYLIGNPYLGYDFARFRVHLDVRMGTIPLGNESSLRDGSRVISIAFPMAIGPSVFEGRIAKLVINNNVPNKDGLTVLGMMLVDLANLPGSSGSVLLADGRVVGILSGGVDHVAFVVPVSRVLNPDPAALLLDKRTPKVAPTGAGFDLPEVR